MAGEWALLVSGFTPPALVLAGWSRSGTTMVTRLAAELPGVAFPPGESQFFRYCGRGLVLRHGPRPRRDAVREALGRYRQHWSGSDMGVQPDAVMERLAGDRLHVADVYGAVVDLATSGASRPADKSNLNVEWLEVVLDRFGEARAIAVVRDPRAVFVSARELGWLSSPAAFARSWARVQATLLGLASGPHSDRVALLRYEDVVADPANAGRLVGAAAGLALPSAGPEAGDAGIPPLFHPREARWKQRALQPPDPSRVARWRDELDAETERTILRVCARPMAVLGYDTSGSASLAAPATVSAPVSSRRPDRRAAIDAGLSGLAEWLTDADERTTDRAGVAMVRSGRREVGATVASLTTRAMSVASQRIATVRTPPPSGGPGRSEPRRGGPGGGGADVA